MANKTEQEASQSRREFLKKAAYVPPVVITMAALPTMKAHGSIGQTDPNDPNGNR